MNPDEPAGMGQLRILWPAFVVSHIVLFVVLVMVIEAPEAEDPILPLVLGVVATGQWAFGLFIAPRVLSTLPAMQFSLVRWALFESVTIFAGVVSFLGGPLVLSMVLFGLALGGMFLTRPTLESVTAWEVRRLSDE